MKRVAWVAVAVLVFAAVVGAFVFDRSQEEAQPDLSQAEIDEFWVLYIREETDPDRPTPASSRPDPAELCDNMNLIADGKPPTGGEAWPSPDVAQDYVKALC